MKHGCAKSKDSAGNYLPFGHLHSRKKRTWKPLLDEVKFDVVACEGFFVSEAKAYEEGVTDGAISKHPT